MSRRLSPDRTEPGRLHRVSIFVPAYNEVANLEGALRDIVGAAGVLADYEVEPWPVNLTYPSARLLPSRTRAFVDWMARALGQALA